MLPEKNHIKQTFKKFFPENPLFDVKRLVFDYRPLDDQSLEVVREGKREYFKGLDITREYLQGRISKENFEQRWDPIEMTKSLIRAKMKMEKDTSGNDITDQQIDHWFNILEKFALNVSSKKELDRLNTIPSSPSLPALTAGGRNRLVPLTAEEIGILGRLRTQLTPEEKMLLKLYFAEAITAKVGVIDVILNRHEYDNEEKQHMEDRKNDLEATISTILGTNRNSLTLKGEIQNHINELKEGPKAAVGGTLKETAPKTKEQVKEIYGKINQKIHQIARNHPGEPNLAQDLSEYFDLDMALNPDFHPTQGMRDFLNDEKTALSKETADIEIDALTLKHYSKNLATIKDRTRTMMDEKVSETTIDSLKAAKKGLAKVWGNIFNPSTPIWIKAGAIALSGYLTYKIATTDNKMVGWFANKAKWGAILWGCGEVISYGWNRRSLLKNAERHFSGRDSNYGESLGSEYIENLYGDYMDNLPKKKKQLVRRDFFQLLANSSSMKTTSALDFIIAYERRGTSDVNIIVPGVSSKAGLTNVLNMIFHKNPTSEIRARYSTADLAKMSFFELFQVMTSEDPTLITQIEADSGGNVINFIDCLRRRNRAGMYYAGFHTPLLTSPGTVHAAAAGHSTSGSSGGGGGGGGGGLSGSPGPSWWESAKDLFASGWFEAGNLFHLSMSTPGGGYTLPDSWIENHGTRKEIKHNLRHETEDDIGGVHAAGSIDFVKSYLAPYEDIFIDPATGKWRDHYKEKLIPRTGPTEELAAYGSAKVKLIKQGGISYEYRLEKSIRLAVEEAKKLVKDKEHLTDEQLQYTGLIDAVIFNQISGTTDPEVRVFIRVPLGKEYSKLQSGNQKTCPAELYEMSKFDKPELLEPGRPLTVAGDFTREFQRIKLFRIFPVDPANLDDILKYLSENEFQGSPPQMKRTDAVREVLKFGERKAADIMAASQKPPRIVFSNLYHDRELGPLKNSNQIMNDIEEKIIDKYIDRRYFGPPNITVAKKHMEEVIIPVKRAFFDAALLSLENPQLLSPAIISQLYPSATEQAQVVEQVEKILYKDYPTKSAKRTAGEIREYYKDVLILNARQYVRSVR